MPGPIFTTATFIGYLLADPWGAGAVAIAAIALLVLIRYRVRSTWLILAGAIAGDIHFRRPVDRGCG